MDSMAKSLEDSDSVKIWGIPLDKCISLIQTLGIPTLFMIFICYLAWSYIPPVVSAHVRLLERTGDTLEKMDETLQQSNIMIEEVVEVERQTKSFIAECTEAHTKAQSTLEKIESAVIQDGNN